MPEEPPNPTFSTGDQLAGPIGSLLPQVYDQLRRAAQQQMASERAGHTLSATALVHEAFLKLHSGREVPWQNRAHFYAAAAEAMRRILLDHAKARGRAKRGGGAARIDLDSGTIILTADEAESDQAGAMDFLALDDAIRRLEARDPRTAEVVRLRFYAGLEIAQVALALGVSERTVKNDWAFARAWLQRALAPGQDGQTETGYG